MAVVSHVAGQQCRQVNRSAAARYNSVSKLNDSRLALGDVKYRRESVMSRDVKAPNAICRVEFDAE